MANEKDPEFYASGTVIPSSYLSQTLVLLLNFLSLVATFSLYYYTQFVYKKPAITEQSERKKLEEQYVVRDHAPHAFIEFDPVTVNLANPFSTPPKLGVEAKPLKGKLHYVTLKLSLEIRDDKWKPTVSQLKPLVFDLLITLIGKNTFEQLTTVQGRYILQTQILDGVNALITDKLSLKTKEPLVTHVYFSDIVVQ